MKNGLLLFIFALVLLGIFVPSYSRVQDIQNRNLELEQQILSLKAEQELLLEEKRKLIEDPVYLEKVAREKMGLVKEGEVVYKIVPEVNRDE